jgi:tetratricopeptide (TPR) repeat protein
MLAQPECVLFRRLAVFAPGFSQEAVEAVCSGWRTRDDPSSSAVFSLLSRLVEQSLVAVETRARETRYRLSDTNREYAFEKLQKAGEVEHARNLHLKYFRRLVESLEPLLPIAWPNAVVDRLEQEYANIIAALEWNVANATNADDALRLAIALPPEWLLRMHTKRGRKWVEKLYSNGGNALSDQERAKTLLRSAFAGYYGGDFSEARDRLERCVDLFRQFNHQPKIAFALHKLGIVASGMSDLTSARRYLEESLTICRALDDRCGSAVVLHELGNVCYWQGETVHGRGLVENSLASLRECGIHYWALRARIILGDIARHEGDYIQASSMYTEAATVLIGHKILKGMLSSVELVRFYWTQVFDAIGFLAADLRLYERAVRMLSAAYRLRQEIGVSLPPVKQAENGTYVSVSRTTLGQAAFDAAWTAGGKMTMDQAVTYAVADEGRPESPGYEQARRR